jgi:putative endonuclease
MAVLVTAIHERHPRPNAVFLHHHHDEPAERHALCRRHQRHARRAWEHRQGVFDGFTKRYGLKRLVYFATFDSISNAIRRKKNIKHWPRAWKVRLILDANPNWDDFYETLI